MGIDKINVPFSTKAGFNSELVYYYSGYEECQPFHSWGPGIRDHFLIHYVIDGSGIYKVDGQTYYLNKGDGFLIYPNTVVSYQADKNIPWTYFWAGFYGMKAEAYLKRAGLDKCNLKFTYNKDDKLKECMIEMFKCTTNTSSRDVKLTGLLYDFIGILIDNKSINIKSNSYETTKEHYFHKALDYIYMNYSRDISISGISQYIGIDRKYLHYIFKKYAKMPPQEFLIGYRMERACELLKDENLKIMYISHSVGYNNPFLFSKIFKKVKGSSPTDYRNNFI